MFLALQRSTYAAIRDLVAPAMFLEAVVLLLSLFISEISPSDTRGKLGLVYQALFRKKKTIKKNRSTCSLKRSDGPILTHLCLYSCLLRALYISLHR